MTGAYCIDSDCNMSAGQPFVVAPQCGQRFLIVKNIFQMTSERTAYLQQRQQFCSVYIVTALLVVLHRTD